MNAIELEHMLRNRGTDYDALIQIHKAHKEFEARVAESFKKFGIEVKLSNRWVQQLHKVYRALESREWECAR